MIVAIDGPAGAGKSTVARAVAAALGFTYLDTGAMYRCVALGQLRDLRLAAEVARSARIEVGDVVRLDGADVSAEIRTPAVSEAASRAAADPAVREALVAQQRRIMARGDWVAEGRDIGTVVAPDAAVKVYLTASAQERARRRGGQLGADVESVLADQAARDRRDIGRAASPLVRAADAVELDTTELSLEQVVARVVALAREAGAPERAQR